MSKTLVGVGLICSFTFGCSEISSTGQKHERPQAYTTLPRWSPDSVSLTCPSADCPGGVGALVFVQALTNGYRLQRCTGSLIARDRVLTNSHCGKGIGYNSAYFFLRKGSVTARFDIGARIFDREDPDSSELEAGMGGDLAVFALNSPVQGIRPLRLARSVPADMGQLVAYLVNEPDGVHFRDFKLNKETCSTVPHQMLFRGGVDDLTVGLALFSCPVTHGNSGSPVFTASNADEIQAVVNSSYPLQTGRTRPLVERIEALFDHRPDFLEKNFAMANRVQCMDVEGQPPAEKLCARVLLADEVRAPFEEGTQRLLRERVAQMNGASSLAWTAKAFPIQIRNNYLDPNPRPGAVIIPQPVCVKGTGHGSGDETQSVLYYGLAMDEHGMVSGTLKKSAPVRVRFGPASASPNYLANLTRDRLGETTYDVTAYVLGEPSDPEARNLLTQDSLALRRCDSGVGPVVDGERVAAFKLLL